VAVEEQQIEMEIVLAHAHALLPGDEGETGAQLQKHSLDLAQDRAFEIAFAVGALQAQQVEQVRIAEHGVGAHPAFAQRVELGRDEGLRLLRQRGALVQHAADLPAKGPHIPALDAAHLGIEVAGQRVLDWQQPWKCDQLNCCDSVTTIASSGTPGRTGSFGRSRRI
jgi:hypothetical protein